LGLSPEGRARGEGGGSSSKGVSLNETAADQQHSPGESAMDCSILIPLIAPNLACDESACAMFSSLLQKAGFSPGLALRSMIPKALVTAAMGGGIGSLLAGGSAEALPLTPPLCYFGTPSGGVTAECTSGIQFELQDKLVTLGALDFGPKSGTLGFQFTPIDPPAGLANDSFALALDFNPDSQGPYSGQFDYTITITDPTNYEFATAQLDSIVTGAPTNTTVTKKILGFANLVSTNGSNVTPVPVSGTTLTVQNLWSVPQGDMLDGFKDVYTQKDRVDVPGPLPVMGAGMAFGFSRKLRSRIKAGARSKA